MKPDLSKSSFKDVIKAIEKCRECDEYNKREYAADVLEDYVDEIIHALRIAKRLQDEPEINAIRDTLSSYTALENKYKNLVIQMDKHFGTPCEQIRHKQEIDDLCAALSAPRYEVVTIEKKKLPAVNNCFDAENYQIPIEVEAHIEGWNDCLDHIAAQGFKIVKEI